MGFILACLETSESKEAFFWGGEGVVTAGWAGHKQRERIKELIVLKTCGLICIHTFTTRTYIYGADANTGSGSTEALNINHICWLLLLKCSSPSRQRAHSRVVTRFCGQRRATCFCARIGSGCSALKLWATQRAANSAVILIVRASLISLF